MKLVKFEGKGLASRWSYRMVGFRPPRRGEYYLSGAIVEAWRAPNDLTTAYHVVEPLREYKLRQTWVEA